MGLGWLGWLGVGLASLAACHLIVRAALARAERYIAAVDADAKRRIRVAQQRALATVDPELRPVVEVAFRQAEDQALWLQELVLPPSPLTLHGLVASSLTARRISRLQRAPE